MLRVLFQRPVGVLLGDPEQPYLCLPLRLADLADLEALAYAAWPNPAEGLPEHDEDTPEHRQRLLKAMDDAEAGPPSWSSTENPRLASLVTLTFLRAVLRDHPGLSEEALERLAGQLDQRQWQRIYRVAWGVEPAREVLVRIDTLIGFPPDTPAGVPWSEAVAQLIEQTGWSLEQIGQLTLPAANLIRSGGKPLDLWDSGPEQPFDGTTLLNHNLHAARERFFNLGST